MKKLFLALVSATLSVTAMAQQVQIPDYVRGSIYSIRLDAPSTSKKDFTNEIAIMKNVFDTLDYKHQYRKYNAFQAGERLMKSTDLPQISDAEAQAIATINGRKKANDDDKYAAQVQKYLNSQNVGRHLVAKWFNKPTDNDMNHLAFDDQMQTIMMWGLMSLSQDQKQNNAQEKMNNSDAAVMLCNELLNSTYVLVTRYDFSTPSEQAQDYVNDKLAPLYEKLEKVPGPLKSTVQKQIDGQMESLKQQAESMFKFNAVRAKSYLFKLKWAGLPEFKQTYIADPSKFPAANFEVEYITTTKGTNPLITEVLGQKINVNKAVANASLKVLNKNVNRLASQYEPFAPIEKLYVDENGEPYVKLGTQDGVTAKSKFTALKKQQNKEGATELVAGGSLTVAKDGLWNNNTEETNVEENAKEDAGNKDLKYTKLSGKSKGISYVRFSSKK